MAAKINTLNADDGSFMINVVMDASNYYPDIEIIDPVRNGQESVDIFKKKAPDVLFFDAAMPIANRITINCPYYLIAQPVLMVLILSGITNEKYAKYQRKIKAI